MFNAKFTGTCVYGDKIEVGQSIVREGRAYRHFSKCEAAYTADFDGNEELGRYERDAAAAARARDEADYQSGLAAGRELAQPAGVRRRVRREARRPGRVEPLLEARAGGLDDRAHDRPLR